MMPYPWTKGELERYVSDKAGCEVTIDEIGPIFILSTSLEDFGFMSHVVVFKGSDGKNHGAIVPFGVTIPDDLMLVPR